MTNLPTELWRWTALDIVKGVRTRTISSREAAQSCFRRIQAVNPTLNALVETSYDEALTAADAADEAVARGELLGPLHGVPVSIKINSDQAGHATTNGIDSRKSNIAVRDSPHVANLRRAGSIFVGRSNTPAFSYRWFTNCNAHGRTLNPWSAAHTPGGSSGGAGAAVASGMVPIAHGNDIGGSVRHPAYACGVAGIRPTVGRVPSWYSSPGGDQDLAVQSMLVQGPLARTIADLRLALLAMSGNDSSDPSYVPLPLEGPSPSRPIRVGLLRDVGVAKPSPSVNAALNEAASYLMDAGYIVEEVELPALAEAYRLYYLIVLEEFRPLLPLVAESGDLGMLQCANNEFLIASEWWGTNPSLADYMAGYARRGTLATKVAEFLKEYPIILLPVSTEQAFEQDADIASVDRTREVMAAQWSMMALPMVGGPALSVPTGVAGGLPIGVQLFGQRFREDMLFDAAEIIEARAGIFSPMDPVFR